MTNSKVTLSFTEHQLDIIMLTLRATERSYTTKGIGKFGVTREELVELFLYINSKRNRKNLEAYR